MEPHKETKIQRKALGRKKNFIFGKNTCVHKSKSREITLAKVEMKLKQKEMFITVRINFLDEIRGNPNSVDPELFNQHSSTSFNVFYYKSTCVTPRPGGLLPQSEKHSAKTASYFVSRHSQHMFK